MIKKNLLFSILIVSISPIFVSTSCKNENKRKYFKLFEKK